MECTQYKSVEGVKHSDHKPVVAHFRVKLKPGSNTFVDFLGFFFFDSNTFFLEISPMENLIMKFINVVSSIFMSKKTGLFLFNRL